MSFVIDWASKVAGLPGYDLKFGNTDLFSGPFAFLKGMHEFRLKHVTFNVTYTCVPKAITATHVMSFSVVTIPMDLDATDTSAFTSLEHAMEHPGAKTSILTTGMVARHRLRWVPTEPTDMDWRLTKNDGICQLFCLTESNPLIADFVLKVWVRATVSLNFRGVNFDGKPPTSIHYGQMLGSIT